MFGSVRVSEGIGTQTRLQRATRGSAPSQRWGGSSSGGDFNSLRAFPGRKRPAVSIVHVRPFARCCFPACLRPHVLSEVPRGNPLHCFGKFDYHEEALLLQKYFVETKPPRVRSCPVCRRPITVELSGVKENKFVASLWHGKPLSAAEGWVIEPSVAFKCGNRENCKGGGYLLSPKTHVLLSSGTTVCSSCAQVRFLARAIVILLLIFGLHYRACRMPQPRTLPWSRAWRRRLRQPRTVDPEMRAIWYEMLLSVWLTFYSNSW